MGGSSDKVTVGYRYYLGVLMVFCHGPIDKVIRWQVDGRTAWAGNSAGGRINIRASNLFGGEKREGGISGDVDILMGWPDQPRNDYMAARLGSDIPAYRGVFSAVLRQVYMGLNPYIKPWSPRAQRIHVRQNGIPQWFDEYAEMPLPVVLAQKVTYTNFSEGWETNAPEKFQIIDEGIANTLVNATNADYWRTPLPVFSVTRFYVEFELVVRDLGDPLGFRFDAADGTHLFSFMPQTEATVDPLGRPSINYWTTGGTDVIYSEPLEQGVRYSVEVIFDQGTTALTYTLRQGNTVLSTGSNTRPVGVPAWAVFGRTSNAQPERTGIAAYSRLEINGYVKSGDMNPAHIIRECLTDPDWGMGYQEADIDDVSFSAAAVTLWDEAMGISILWDREASIMDFVQEILRHIDAALYVDRNTGKFALKLIRADYDPDELPVFDESNIKSMESYKRRAFGELVNAVTVNYWDAQTGKTASLPVQDIALIQGQGAVISQTVAYPGFTNANVASRAAQRDLRALSSPLLSCTFIANRDAEELDIGSAFKLAWPDYHDGHIIMRVAGLGYGDGTDNTVRVECTQDVFSTPLAAVIAPPVEEWQDPSQRPDPAQYRAVFEAPYYELVQRLGQVAVDQLLTTAPDSGYLLASAGRPEGGISASLMVDAGAGYDDKGTVEFSPVAWLSEGVSKTATVLPVTDGESLDEIRIGSVLQLGDELVRVDAVSDEEIEVGRGVLDTVPQDHPVGTLLMAWDDFAEGDGVEYIAPEEIAVKLLPVSGAGEVALQDATADIVTMDSRAVRPYPPGNVRVNGEPYLESMAASAALALSWSHRDRIQQTAGLLVDTSAGNIGPEAGVTYNLRIYAEDSSSLLREVLGISGTEYTYPTLTELEDVGAVVGLVFDAYLSDLEPTHWWRMNEASGGSLASVVGGWSAALAGGYTLASDGLLAEEDDKAVLWGGGYAVTSASSTHLLGAGDFSVSCLLQYTASSFSTALAIRTSSPTPLLCLITTGRITAGDVSAESWNWSNEATRVRHPGANDGNPHHVAVVYRHETMVLELWVDGLLRDSRFQGSGRPTAGSVSVHLGSNTGGVQPFSGTQDEVALFDRALAPEEVETLAELALTGPAVVGARLNGSLRFELESVRDGYTSYQAHNHTVKRVGYGFNYGEFYGGE